MNITIGFIKVNYINNLGSMNIGKTILCRNNAIVSSSDKGAGLSGEQNLPEAPGPFREKQPPAAAPSGLVAATDPETP